MNLDELLRTLEARRVLLWVDGQALRFRGEAGALDAPLLAQLRRHKKDLIAHLNQQEPHRNGETTSQGRWEPLSIGQQALYFLHITHPHSPAYNVASAARITSEVNLESMRSAFQSLISRHEALRTTFEIQHGEPRSRIHPQGMLDFEQIEVPGWSEAAVHAEVKRLYQQPFNLETGPLLRVRLLSRSQTDHVFLMALHHIVFDAWSLWLVQDEFRKLYRQNTGGTAALFPALKASYSDYAKEQDALKTNDEGKRLWAYWKERLQGELIPPELPVDFPRSELKEPGGATWNFRIPADLTLKLRALGRARGATLFVVLLAIFKVLLYRYTNQEDLIVGTTTSGRDVSKYRGVVGYFVNTLPIRTETSQNQTFAGYLTHIKSRTLEAIEHQSFPFPLLVDRLNPRRDKGRQPICPIMFSLQKPQQFSEVMRLFDENAGPVDWGGLEVHPFPLDQQEGQFELSLDVFESPESFLGVLRYDPHLFSRQTIERLAGHFVRLAEAIASDPNRAVDDYELLSEEERDAVLGFGFSGEPVEPSERLVHRLVERQAERTPRNIALVCGNRSLTYETLNRRANQAARWLRSRGVQEGSVVACRLLREMDAAAMLLGILKAGGVYVPLDAASPEARIQEMLEDCQADFLVISFPSSIESESVQVLPIDEFRETASQFADANLEQEFSSNPLAYVLYTSGSTGRPKGVCVSHAAFAEHILSIREAFGLQEADRVLQFSNFTFDPSLHQFFAPWSLGASVVMRGDELWPPDEFWNFAEAQELSVLYLPPAYFRQCNEAVARRDRVPKSVRTLIIGGDVFPAETLETWNGKGVRIFNSYGPTEAVISVAVHDAMFHDPRIHPRVPIGRPKRGVRAYVLDQNQRLVPVGAPGELYLGGSPLAEGYFHDSELTAQKFVPDPFTGQGRMYRTGDRAAWRADGLLDFLGRRDRQVKIHGVRLELGEIEAALNRCPEVRQSCVLSRPDGTGEMDLVAWVETEGDSEGLAERLRDHLQKYLPRHLVPRQFVPLAELPVNASGKINVSALPEPSLMRAKTADVVPPRNPIEQEVARIWSEVLKVEPVGVEDDFFDLGGGSLSSLKIVTRLWDAGLTHQGHPVKPELLFEYPSVAELAARLETRSPRA